MRFNIAMIQAVVKERGRGKPICVAYCSPEGLKMLRREVRNMACDDFRCSKRKVKTVVK